MLDYDKLRVSNNLYKEKDKYFANIDIFVEDETKLTNILLGRKILRFSTVKDMIDYFKNKLGVEIIK